MRKLLALSFVTAIMISFGSCKNKAQQQDAEVEADTISYVNKDQTIYGLCGEGSAMNTLELVTDVGDTLILNVTMAQENGRVFGGYNVGDKMAVMANADRTEATLVINESALLGNWVMPNPIDGSDEVGISLKEGGVAESIDQSSIVYRTWKIFNGQLVIQSIREGGGDMEETGVYDLVLLAPDSLVYKDTEDTFEYGRQQERKSNVDIKLEEASEDDYRI